MNTMITVAEMRGMLAQFPGGYRVVVSKLDGFIDATKPKLEFVDIQPNGRYLNVRDPAGVPVVNICCEKA